jgi:lipopolysaccharide/colanic/teichoic acid biosynthesis glycosyltransferase
MAIKLLYIGSWPDLINESKERDDLFELTVVANGVKTQDLLKKGKKFDGILCEAILPGMNGLSIAKMVKGYNGYSKTPFIIVGFEKDLRLFKKLFKEKSVVDDYYVTPVDVERLAKRFTFLKNYYQKYIHKRSIEGVFQRYKIPFIKRAFDIIVSLTAILILLPVFILVAIAIKLESKGGIIYKSKRVGTGYKIFDFYKFRSMYTGADAQLKELEHLNKYNAAKKEAEEKSEKSFNTDCPRCKELPKGQHCSPLLFIDGKYICEYWYKSQKKNMEGSTFIKIKDDPRITKVGRFIRNTSIDELPQLFNVLKGDMSIVGNRPLPLYEAELLTSDDWSARFMGPAGITGLWQVELRSKKGEMSEEERKSLDNEYSKNYSFWGDIKLILRTIPALLQKETV